MNAPIRLQILRRCSCCRLVGLALLFLLSTTVGTGEEASKPPAQNGAGKPAKPASGARNVEVLFADGSNLKLLLKDEPIQLSTAYGKLRIPIAAIRRIDFATRIPPDIEKRLDATISKLGSPQFWAREESVAELKKLREWAFPFLIPATKHKDPEIGRRAEKLIEEMKASIPEELLEIRKDDVVYAGESKIVGQIESPVLGAKTSQFGDVQLKLTDLRELRSPGDRTTEKSLGKKWVGKRVQVMQGNRWWPADIVEVKSGAYLIHYTGYDPSQDEWVTKDRIQFSDPTDPPKLLSGNR
jgi:hypothetical protein